MKIGKTKYYDLKKILEYKAQYNIIFGERSNGKTYSCLERVLKIYCETKKQGAYLRRWSEDFRGKRGKNLFTSIVENGLVKKYTKGEWSDIYYYSGQWFLCRFDEELNKRIIDETPFCLAFALTAMEHDKSNSYPNITTIVLDEFLTRNGYLPDEFTLFTNVISTIVRQRNDVTIFMLGNTVNKYCPYFNEMGLKHIDKMEKGDIDLYNYGESGLRVVVEYADSPNKSKDSDVYFAFDNSKLKMITNGVWEVALYPHVPCKYSRKDIVFTYFIIFNANLLQCEIVVKENMIFTYIHRKSTPLKSENRDLIYDTEYHPQHNYMRRITKPTNEMEKKVYMFFVKEKVFYQDNEVGEIIRNYIQWCNTEKVR